MCTRPGQSEFTHWNKLDDTTGGNALEVKHLSVHWPSGRTLPVVAWEAALWKVLQSPEGTFHIHTLPSSVPASRTGAQGCHSSHCGRGSREDHRHQTTPALPPLKRSSATTAVQRVLVKHVNTLKFSCFLINTSSSSKKKKKKTTQWVLPDAPTKQTEFYLQIPHFEGPDLLFALHLPHFDQAAHVARRHQRWVVAEGGACHRVLVACGGGGTGVVNNE